MTAPALTYHTITLITMTCSCGVTYALDEEFRAQKQKDGSSWRCPNGCTRVYRESDIDKARKEAERKAADAAYWRDRMLDEQKAAQSARNRERAQKAAKTRLKNRIAKGVCPCCNRHFANVQRHIENQHPDYVAADAKGTPNV